MHDDEQMSSSMFTGRWTSVNDLTRQNHVEKPLGSFYLQSEVISTPPIVLSSASTIRPSKSLLSLVEPPTAATPLPPPIPPRTFRRLPLPIEESKVPSDVRLPSSRVASIIHRFESGDNASMNHPNDKMVSPPTRLLPRGPVEIHPCKLIPFDSKQLPKTSPIIIYERRVDEDRLPSSPLNPSIEIPSRIEIASDQAKPHFETIIHQINISPTVSHSIRSSVTTTDFTSSSSRPIPDALSMETIHSTQSQRTSLCRSCSPPLTSSDRKSVV